MMPSKPMVLIGFMGAGKSATGRALERRTGWARYEIDDLIVARFGAPIPEIFAAHGEAGFRQIETEVLHELETSAEAIVVTGGGTVLRRENVELLRKFGPTVWLTVADETLRARLARSEHRPLLRTADRGATALTLLREREPLYRACADFTINTTAFTVEEVAVAILQRVKTK